MSNNIEIKNGIIDDTFLGIEEYGIFTFYLHLDYGTSTQNLGGWVLATEYGECGKNLQLIRRILNIVGVDRWEKLLGKYVRVKADLDMVHAIGNILNEDWLDFDEFFGDENE